MPHNYIKLFVVKLFWPKACFEHRRTYGISIFIKESNGPLARWYNRRHARYGVPWTDRFKSVLLEKGAALAAVAVYIELDRVRTSLCDLEGHCLQRLRPTGRRVSRGPVAAPPLWTTRRVAGGTGAEPSSASQRAQGNSPGSGV
jgi:hypothetical protein